MATTILSDLGPWDEQTIALLLGIPPSKIQIKRLGRDSNNTHRAQLTFQSEQQMHKIINCYHGQAIPMTHGYHYYTFDVVLDEEMVDPPLHLQLMALPSTELERRLRKLLQDEYEETVKYSNNKRDKVYTHASLAYQLAEVVKCRPVKFYRGVPVPKDAHNELLKCLRSCNLWPSKETQRRGISASNYLTVRKQHGHEYNQIWDLCSSLIETVIPEATYNALAITRGFKSSPHVDLHDTTFQHVIALGDFTGGQLCCEADTDGIQTAAIDVQRRFGRIDGRFVHWVNGWKGERYSVVYYSTDGRDGTERVCQVEHLRWMERHLCQDVKMEKVPVKRYGRRVNVKSDGVNLNARLPGSLPIVGLGCSSYSSFFSTNDEALTVDTITKDHPAVKGWIETIRHAVLDRGIFLLDTAPWYGHGTSEKVVGFALDTILSNEFEVEHVNSSDKSKTESQFSNPPRRLRTGLLHRSSLIINTKVGRYESDPLKQFDFSYDTTIKSVFRSLERMNCNYIDVLQLHDPEFAPNMSILMEETIPALLECKKRGWTKAIGLTGYPLEVQHEILVKCSEQFQDGLVFDQSLVYCHHNLHDMSLFCDDSFSPLTKAHEQEKDTVETALSNNITFADFCQQNGIGLMCAAPLSMGLLTNQGPMDWHPASPSLKEACVETASLCRAKGVDISNLAMLYSLSISRVGCTLVGMKNIKEVDAAADLAARFGHVDFEQIIDANDSSKDSEMNPVLEQVLTTVEKEVLLQLLNPESGPFANVWNRGDYRWDGKAEAVKFWSLVEQLKRGES